VFLGDWLGRRALLTPDKVALIDATRGNRPITYRQWNQAANRSAQLLRTLGAGKGDLVAILAHNCVEFLDAWFACGKLGAILQTLNWRLTPRELVELIRDAGPKVLVHGPEFVDQVRGLREAGLESVTRLALDADARAFPNDRRFRTIVAMMSVTGLAMRPRRRSSSAGTTPGSSATRGGRPGLPKGPF